MVSGLLFRRHDFENFLATLLLPPVSQDGAMAVRAFNVSAALVADQVTQKAVGQMRIKFWDDAIDSVYSGSPPAQPVAVQLHKAVQRHKLSKRWLRRVLSSREDGLSEKAFPTMAALDTYSENSVSSVLYLTLECLGFRDVHADHAASHIGRAQGAVTLLRAIPHNASRRRVLVPLELLAKHKVSQQDIVRGSCSTSIKDLIFDIAGSANAHLEKVTLHTVTLPSFFTNQFFNVQAASMRHQVPSAARVALLPEVCVLSYLQRLRKADFNVFDGGLQQRHQLLPASLLWAKFRH